MVTQLLKIPRELAIQQHARAGRQRYHRWFKSFKTFNRFAQFKTLRNRRGIRHQAIAKIGVFQSFQAFQSLRPFKSFNRSPRYAFSYSEHPGVLIRQRSRRCRIEGRSGQCVCRFKVQCSMDQGQTRKCGHFHVLGILETGETVRPQLPPNLIEFEFFLSKTVGRLDAWLGGVF